MTSPTQSAMEQQQREAFEAWAKKNLLPLTEWTDEHGPYYAHEQTYAAWGAWKECASELRSLRDSLALAKADLERYRWLRDNFLGADFDYGGNDAEMRNGEQVLLIRHAGTPVWGSLDLTVDAALNKEQP